MLKPETVAVHAGFYADQETGAVMPPIYQTSTYLQRDIHQEQPYVYSRTDNPTRTPLQLALAELERGKHGLVFSSGLAAIDAVLNTLSSGDHVIAGDDLYGGSIRLFTRVAQQRGLTFDFVDLARTELVEAAFKPNTKLVWMETPTNPLLKVVDIERVAGQAHAHGALLAVDNTFMSPYFQNPLSLGADLVMHSMTKYINGHSDVVMGCLVMNSNELYDKLKFLQNSIGAIPSPFDCFLALRGIRTLAVRMKAHAEGAAAVATWLQAHPKVDAVLYPGLKSHPGHEIAARQTSGHGGMLSFVLKGSLADAQAVLTKVELFKLAESLGGVESLIEHPATMTHASVPVAVREQQGINDGLIRISVGIENPEDLIADLSEALT